MTTALTGSLGWTGLHPIQLGGPPLTNTWRRPLPQKAVPLLAHVYSNDGVTFQATYPVLSWSPIKATLANGGYDQVTLSLAAVANLTQGNVIRLSEVGSPWPGFLFGGVIEDVPDSITPTAVTHNVLLTHFAFELDDVQSTSVYTLPTDLSQIVRDAVAQTFHCSCDEVSVPVSTGIFVPSPATVGGALDFRNQTIKQQIDTCRSMAGATWYWFVDELGRVWFQAMGSAGVYTVYRGPHYEQRTSSNSIENRKNRVTVIGGVPTGGSANATGTYNGSSQTTLGVRALFPPLSLPNITDSVTLTLIADNIGAVLDRIWRQANLVVHSPFGQRIHGSQPGGAMLRYFEPIINPIPESESGSGSYIGPFITNSVSWDGVNQTVVAGDIPVTSQTDVQNMINSLSARFVANSFQVTGAALNLQQTLTGSFQSGMGTLTSNGGSAALWSLTQQEFQAIDPNGVTRAEMGNLNANGVSPAQWGFRANDSTGTPIFDSIGAIGLPKLLAEVIQTTAVQGTNTSFADVSGLVTSSFTLTRQSTVVVFAMGRFAADLAGSGNVVFLGIRCGSNTTTGSPAEVDSVATRLFVPYCIFFRTVLAAGSYTAALQAQTTLNTGGNQWNVAYGAVDVYLFGG